MTPDFLNAETRKVFDILSEAKELKGMCLIGGTALTLHLNHRNSLDLDFTLFGEGLKLPSYKIDALIRRLKDIGHQAHLITDQAAISATKINHGFNLLDYARDYVINGVKVTFFTKGQAHELIEQYESCSENHENIEFSILSVNGLKITKTLVLGDRIRSRDLFDVMWLIKNNYLSLDVFFELIDLYANNDDHEYYKNILTGLIPLDKTDEGLDPVNVEVNIEDIYAYFSEIISQFEVKLAHEFLKGNP